MTDIVVTLPKSFGIEKWMAEGDAHGEEWGGQRYYWKLGKQVPKIEAGERVYVVYNGNLIGYAPLLCLRWDINGTVYLVRGGGAQAVTIGERIPGFRGYRYRWWDLGAEVMVA